MQKKISYTNIYRIVKQVPRGKVATYGQIAALAGIPAHARQVGYALHASPEESDIPWHRVINSRGKISRHPDPIYGELQRNLLEAEGIIFDAAGCISLTKYQWRPPGVSD